ncbi:MAG: AAA family ATPase, partial [Propionibacteriaceae bacterium]|nr:AAA family ATPase [Propionibacteriaceae bacterium]
PYQAAVAAALGSAADSVAVADIDSARRVLDHLKSADLGRAALLLARSNGQHDAEVASPSRPKLPGGSRWAVDIVTCAEILRPAVTRVLARVAVVEDLAAAHSLVASRPDLIAVTREGDVLGAHSASGGSSAQPSLIEVQAAIDDAQERLAEANHAYERLRFAATEIGAAHGDATRDVEITLARLHESDAAMAAVAEQLGQLSSSAKAAQGEADRLQQTISRAEESRDRDLAGLAELEQRLSVANATSDEPEPDPATRDRLAEQARLARSSETEARLALRTMEERVRALTGRSEGLRRAADHERQARAKAFARRERLLREATTAAAVHAAGSYLAAQVERSISLASHQRNQAQAARGEADAALSSARTSVRTLTAELESLVDTVHRDELARAEQRIRVEALAEKAMTELGLEADALVAGYGPHLPVPVLTREDGSALTSDDEQPDPVAYVREVQQKRLRSAERALAVLGRVNPLALEEFDALEQRHRFLSEQLDDLRRTRKDLMEIIEEVDHRVEQVFAEAYRDVEQAFQRVFARLFPGGEGRLVLTEPGNWLTTGVDVEARPPGKKIKRLSLLSGGERSLVAVAFLVALFIARPSPFYILDEVEAALDDTNLGRLLEIYEELRAHSQLLVITHQKRTMEVADALYGVTMRGDGVSAVISQRLREIESVA